MIVVATHPTPIRVTCERCKGCGQRPLIERERRLLSVIPSEWTATADVAAAFPRVKRTALLYRLQRLVDLGLVESRFVDPDGQVVERARLKQWRSKPATEGER